MHARMHAGLGRLIVESQTMRSWTSEKEVFKWNALHCLFHSIGYFLRLLSSITSSPTRQRLKANVGVEWTSIVECIGALLDPSELFRGQNRKVPYVSNGTILWQKTAGRLQ